MLTTILLQAAEGGAGGAGMMNLLLIVGIIVVFYFFMIRPQQKRQKEIRKAREAMGPGSPVVTAGGIHGKIKEVKETTFIIEIANGVTIKVEKTSVYAGADDAAAAQK